MTIHLSRRQIILGIVLAALIGIAIYAANDEPDTHTASIGYVPLVTRTPNTAPPARIVSLPGGASSTSALVMVQGAVERRLVVWPLLSDGSPEEVDRAVNMSLLQASPGGTHVLYRTDRALMVLDVAARRAVIAGTLPTDSKLIRAQWSPDGKAIAYVLSTAEQHVAYYTRYNGTQDAEPMLSVPRGLPVDVAWLPPARPVVIFMSIGPLGGLEARYVTYDPNTSDKLLLPEKPPVQQPHDPWRSADGAHQLYQVLRWPYTVQPGNCTTSTLAITGPEWVSLALAGSGQPHDVVFAINALYMDWPTWLPDGRVLFRGISDDTCLPHGSGLYIGDVEAQQARLLVEADPAYMLSADEDVVWDFSYDLSPDRTLVAWTHNDMAAQTSRVQIMPIDSGPAEVLFQTQPPPDDAQFDFVDRQMIMHFIWLP
jgi:hypothetical protein